MATEEVDPYLREVRSYLGETFGSGPDGISADEPLLGGILDSIALLSLAAHLEERYGITVGAHEVGPENFGTLRTLAAFVSRKARAA